VLWLAHGDELLPAAGDEKRRFDMGSFQKSRVEVAVGRRDSR
jgi:hypothetical protein